MPANSTINQEEINKFSMLSGEWWKPDGKFKILHQINPVRLTYIRQKLSDANFNIKKLKILDVGCGGGLVSIPLARTGALVTAIDASYENSIATKMRAEQEGLKIECLNTSIEGLATLNKTKLFDCIVALEILEHVENPDLFIKCCATLLKPGGIIFISTINKNYKSLFFAKFCAEYILRFVPKGTHEWQKFLTPSNVCKMLKSNGIEALDMSGISLSILDGSWQISDNVELNYIMCGLKSPSHAGKIL